MNYTKLFYWLTVADNAKTLFVWGITIFTLIAVASTITNIIFRVGSVSKTKSDGYSNKSDDERKEDAAVASGARGWMKWSIPLSLLFWSLYILTPSKKDALLIVAGGTTLNFLSTDSSAKQIPHELSSFLVTEIRNLAEDTKVELNINDNKNKILEEAKSLTGEQLIEKLKTDSTLKNIILNP